jgi:hypothetical protein
MLVPAIVGRSRTCGGGLIGKPTKIYFIFEVQQ